MKLEKRVIKHLHSMGFETKKFGEYIYVFEYEEMRILYTPDDEDENYLFISLPIICQVTKENRTKVLKAIEDCARVVKYSKMHLLDGDVGVLACYEHYLTDTKKLPELLEHILQVLIATARHFVKIVDNKEGNSDEEVESALEKILREIEEENQEYEYN